MVLSKQELPVVVPTMLGAVLMFLTGPGDNSSSALNALYDWQTIAGALLALLGAWFTVGKIREQIDLVDKHEAARIRRMHQSRLAALPLALSALCEHLKQTYESLEAARAIHSSSGNSGLVQQWDYPELAPELLVELQRYLEAADEPNAIALVTGVFQQLQTLNARMRSLKDRANMAGLIGVQMNLVEYQFQTATIYSMVESLFPFARGETSCPPSQVERQAVISRLDHFSDHSQTNEEFQSRLASFRAPASPAWPRGPF